MAQASPSHERLHRAIVDLLARSGPPRTVIDVGCSDGALATRLRDAGHATRCCDLTAHPEVPGVEHRAGDLLKALPFEDGADAVVCCEVLEHLLEPASAFARLAERVRPGGVLLVTLPNYWNITHRFRYLLTGHLQRCKCSLAREEHGYLPHVSSPTIETWAFLGRREGLAIERVEGVSTPWFRLLPHLPLLLAVGLWKLLAGRRREHPEANALSVLAGRHVALVFRRVEARARATLAS